MDQSSSSSAAPPLLPRLHTPPTSSGSLNTSSQNSVASASPSASSTSSPSSSNRESPRNTPTTPSSASSTSVYLSEIAINSNIPVSSSSLELGNLRARHNSDEKQAHQPAISDSAFQSAARRSVVDEVELETIDLDDSTRPVKCRHCGENLARIECPECKLLLCSACDTLLHFDGESHNHMRKSFPSMSV